MPQPPDANQRASLDDTTSAIIKSALKLHQKFGGCLLEGAYELLMVASLQSLGFKVARQRLISVVFEGIELTNAFRVDLIVNETVVVEIKSIDRLSSVHERQVLTYLRFMNLPVGLLINFGQETLKDGLRRIVNNLDPGDSPTLRVNQSPKSI